MWGPSSEPFLDDALVCFAYVVAHVLGVALAFDFEFFLDVKMALERPVNSVFVG